MDVYRISAVTLKVRDMKESCDFYSRMPGFRLVYGGAGDLFTTFEIGGSKAYLNLELANDPSKQDFGRVIFHTDDVDGLYRYMKNDRAISVAITFETEPADALWGERFFHVREPNGYLLSFASPLKIDKEH